MLESKPDASDIVDEPTNLQITTNTIFRTYLIRTISPNEITKTQESPTNVEI